MPAAAALAQKGAEGPAGRLTGVPEPQTPAPWSVCPPPRGRLRTENARVSLGPLPEPAATC